MMSHGQDSPVDVSIKQHGLLLCKKPFTFPSLANGNIKGEHESRVLDSLNAPRSTHRAPLPITKEVDRWIRISRWQR